MNNASPNDLEPARTFTSPSTPLSREDSLKGRYLTSPSEDLPTAIEAFHTLSKNQPLLTVHTKPLKSGDMILQPLDATSIEILQHTASPENGKTLVLKPTQLGKQ